MQLIYDNLTKLFDVFTRGTLAEQGANSEILLRQVYRALDEDFIKIIQNSDAVDKIAEAIKRNQEGATAKSDNPLVSNTTKKVVKNTLEPSDLDPASMVLDFTNELQTAILQVKMDLSREWDRQKIGRIKSIDGQKDDLDRLNDEFQN